MYVIYQRFGTKNLLAWIALGALCLSSLIGRPDYAFAIFGSYIVVHLAQRNNIGSTLAQKWGDLSYGLYLFGWPATASIKHFAGTESGWVLIAYRLPLTFALAAVSWWAIERPCIGLKHVFRRTQARQ
jgi:peptidoglycan/LPS O-acetylase OafA/YrhL